jgi:hypothetical protein
LFGKSYTTKFVKYGPSPPHRHTHTLSQTVQFIFP